MSPRRPTTPNLADKPRNGINYREQICSRECHFRNYFIDSSLRTAGKAAPGANPGGRRSTRDAGIWPRADDHAEELPSRKNAQSSLRPQRDLAGLREGGAGERRVPLSRTRALTG